MLLRKEIHFHFFSNLIKNSLGPQPEISVAQRPGLNANSCSREDYKCKNCNGKYNFSICTNKNPLKPRFDNLSDPSSNSLASNQANVLLQTAFVRVGDLLLQKRTVGSQQAMT